MASEWSVTRNSVLRTLHWRPSQTGDRVICLMAENPLSVTRREKLRRRRTLRRATYKRCNYEAGIRPDRFGDGALRFGDSLLQHKPLRQTRSDGRLRQPHTPRRSGAEPFE